MGVSAKQCIDECSSRPRCTAATVHRKLHICKLSSSVIQDGDLLEDGGSVAFLGFNDLKDRDSCGENTCSKKEACKHIGGNFVCQTMECGKPNFIPTSFETAGNVYSTGARMLLSNTYYRSYIECNTSGEWCVNDVTWRECDTTCIKINDYQYWYIPISTTMEQAELFCRLGNSHLIEVKSHHDTTEVLKKLLKPNQLSWIGLVDKDRNRKWRWLSGSAVEYTNWKPGEPNNYKDVEYCVLGIGPYSYWNDAPCNQHRPFICQGQVRNADDPDTLTQCL